MTLRTCLIDIACLCSLAAATGAGMLVAAAFDPAHAQTPAFPASVSPGRMNLEPGGGDCFAHVRIENRSGRYNATETLTTERGPVSIAYQTIGDHKPGDDDRITVASLPPDVYARPMEASIPDGESLTVCLYEWRGM